MRTLCHRRGATSVVLAVLLASSVTAGRAAAQSLEPYDAPPQPVAPAPAAPPAAPPAPNVWVPAPAVSEPPDPPPAEVGLAAGQIALGALSMVVSGGLLVGLPAAAGADPVAIAGFLATPLVTGFLVCSVGRTSDVYDGRCVGPIAGAYLGALSAVPLMYLGCALDDTGGDLDCLGGAALGLLAGLVLGAPIGATIGWHAAKEPRHRAEARAARRVLASAPPSAPSWPESRRSGAGAGQPAGGTQLLVPVLSLRF